MIDESTLAEELTRKSGEALVWVDNALKRGHISESEAHTALMALDLATLGLIPNEYSAWASETRSAIGMRPLRAEKVVLRKQKNTVVVDLDRTVGRIIITQIGELLTDVKVLDFKTSTDTIQAACERFPRLLKDLTDRGYNVVA